MTQRWIEVVIGKLVTDAELRRKFSNDPRQTLLELVEQGTHLTHAEIVALMSTAPTLWEQTAEHIDLAGINATLK